jgi:hypothetical protein
MTITTLRLAGYLQLADSSASGGPAGPLALIIIGALVVAAIVVVSAVLLKRLQHRDREARLDAQYEARKAEQAQPVPAEQPAASTREDDT